MKRAPLHLCIPAQATVERGLYAWRPWALGQGRSQHRQQGTWVFLVVVMLLGGRDPGGATRGWCGEIAGAVLGLRALPLQHCA